MPTTNVLVLFDYAKLSALLGNLLGAIYVFVISSLFLAAL